jgi:hypothetical protein
MGLGSRRLNSLPKLLRSASRFKREGWREMMLLMVTAADELVVLTDEYEACVEVEAEELRRRELRRREGEKREAMFSKRELWAILLCFSG